MAAEKEIINCFQLSDYFNLGNGKSRPSINNIVVDKFHLIPVLL